MRNDNKITFFISSSEKYGDLMMDVESGKKEDRSHAMKNVPFRKFLDTYKEADVYMVQDIQDPMKGVTIVTIHVHQLALVNHCCI